jgi:formiminoglutamate deiminase
MVRLFFDHALLPDGWAQKVRIEIDSAGWITGVAAEARVDGAAFHGTIGVPGMPNLHSHAFQRAMAGLTETPGAAGDSFWTWRQVMYGFLERLTPCDLAAIATQLYVEMLEAGFTAVAEFHYLHHDPAGRPYGDIGAMSAAIAEAAAISGIGVTFLPVFYANGGFGGAAPGEGQRRFVNSPTRYARLLDRVRKIAADLPDAAVGVAPHSLRAVTPECLAEIAGLCPGGPIHIHVAEQIAEVEDCIAWSGQRPVQWLLANAAVDRRWCLIHATHMTPHERRGLAASGAVAGLCPITEANLGDGVFDAVVFLAEGGSYGIGSDANTWLGVAGELRQLEYSQRLRDGKRNLLAGNRLSTGRGLYDHALAGGAQATGRRIGRLAPGYRGDIVALDADHVALFRRSHDQWLDSWLFAGDNSVVRDVWVGGRQVVADGVHHARQAAGQAYRKTLAVLLNP